MNVFVLYCTAVLIWGTTWIAISFQLGDVHPEVSLAYRFGLASIMLFGYCWVTRLNLKFSFSQHVRLFGIAISMFGFNYYLLYNGQQHLDSAMAAIAFSTLMVMNIVNGRIFLGTAISPREYGGAGLGLLGICTLFWPQLTGLTFNTDSLFGLGLCLAGTFIASLSNMLSVSNQKQKMPIVQSNAWAMGYGASTMALLAVFNDHPFPIDLPVNYWLAMGYLALFGSVIVFGIYLHLLGKIGANKTSYITIITPAVAVVISSIFEDFTFTTYTVSGLLLILAGNVTVLLKSKVKPVQSQARFTDEAKAV
ncbi:MAG: DMT family transporter [Algicola sp.]|nr:DMT family transporter [Algicola sp.]